MAITVPHSPPLGEPMPDSPHAVTTSMPTWESVIAWAKREPWMVKAMMTGYPRFFINTIIRNLSQTVLQRLNLPSDGDIFSMIFVNELSAARCVAALDSKNPDGHYVEVVRFFPPSESDLPSLDAQWLSFHVVLYSNSLDKEAKAYWRDSGDGISTRHAQFCLDRMDLLQSTSINPLFSTPPATLIDQRNSPAPLHTTGAAEASNLKEFIAKLATSDRRDEGIVKPENVFLFSRGMSAIYAVARALASAEGPSDIVAYGWLYAETTKVIRRTNSENFIFYGKGRAEDLDDLEASLASGKRIQTLFCEFPGNPLLVMPDLNRIGKLARTYDFIVACDDTVATFVNVDILPDVDILITSLTKMFSGYCDVMGGSVVINPKSRYYDFIHSRITAEYEDTFFPLDIVALNNNSVDFVQRVHDSNSNGKLVAEYLATHPSVLKLNYPSMVSTAPFYEQYRRRDGGYGHLLSIVFHEERSAITFYNSLDVCKGTSFGTNFSLAIPYVQLAHYHEQDWVESYGVCRHIVRLSVGLETPDEILKTVSRALRAVEQNDLN